MRIEEQHTDVMQNLEFAVAVMYRDHPAMADYAALRVYEALLEAYSAERAGRPARPAPLDPLEQELLVRVREMCEWRLGRAPFPGDEGEPVHDDVPLPPDTLILCLKRLVKSANTWTRRSGRQGYLKFMSPFALGSARRGPHASGATQENHRGRPAEGALGPGHQRHGGAPLIGASGPSPDNTLSLHKAAPWPVLEALIAAGWRDTGRLSEILVAKSPPFGGVVACVFLVDLGCLGPKQGFVSQFSNRREYQERFRALMLERCDLQPVAYCLAAKVLHESLRYAQGLGLEPSPGVRGALSALGPLEQPAAACLETVPLGGPDGRPFYMAGPDDDTDRIRATLTRVCGAGNFVFAVPTGPFPAGFFD